MLVRARRQGSRILRRGDVRLPLFHLLFCRFPSSGGKGRVHECLQPRDGRHFKIVMAWGWTAIPKRSKQKYRDVRLDDCTDGVPLSSSKPFLAIPSIPGLNRFALCVLSISERHLTANYCIRMQAQSTWGIKTASTQKSEIGGFPNRLKISRHQGLPWN